MSDIKRFIDQINEPITEDILLSIETKEEKLAKLKNNKILYDKYSHLYKYGSQDELIINAGVVCHNTYNNTYYLKNYCIGAEDTFSIGQPVYNKFN